MKLSVIITHYKTLSVLKLCLGAIEKSCSGIEYEVIVSDSESDFENDEKIKEKFPKTIFIPFKENVGYAKLVNAGIKIAKGEFILILNADIIPKDNSIKTLIGFLEKNPGAGIVGPQLLNFDESAQSSAFRYYSPWTVVCRRTFLGKTPWGKSEIDKFLLKEKLEKIKNGSIDSISVDWLMGSALMARNEAIKKVGLLDESFFMYFEDVDWARRFWENGYKVVFFPKAQMYHYHYKASDKGRGVWDLFFNRQTRIHFLSALKYFWKYTDNKMKGVFKKAFVVFLILISLGVFFGFGYYWGKKDSQSYILQKFISELEKTNQLPDSELVKSIDFSLFWNVWDRISENFLNSDKIDNQKMIYGAISGMVKSLGDPYTQFMTPEESKMFIDDVTGSFEGIGAEIGIRKEQLQVIAPLEGTPAQKAGLRSGDKILKIDDKMTSDLTVDEAIKLIRGTKGSFVTLTILRDESPKEFKIQRDVINVPSLKLESKGDGISHVQIYSFSENLSSDFKKVARKIIESGDKKIILDLRDNPGGYLEIAEEVAGWFLKKDNLVVIEDFGKKGEQNKYKTKSDGKFSDMPVVVLINQGSASASEILAGALRDSRKIILIGEKSFGKGSVQNMEKFSDGSSVKITVARWLTPSGKSIMDEGLEPDIKIEITQDDFEKGIDPQLNKAIEVIKNLQ